jgi:NADH-quinone oxidoreductase subunit J
MVMTYEIIFYFLAVTIGVLSLSVITTKNPVYAVLLLIATFFASSGIFIMLGAEFLAMLLIIVYVGAVAVLFLFVVMMLDINFAKKRQGFIKHFVIGALLSAVIFGQILWVIKNTRANKDIEIESKLQITSQISNTKQLGMVLYTDYILLFQTSGLILLVAMIGAIVLTLRTKGNMKKQKVSSQIMRDPKEAVKLVQVKSGQGIK